MISLTRIEILKYFHSCRPRCGCCWQKFFSLKHWVIYSHNCFPSHSHWCTYCLISWRLRSETTISVREKSTPGRFRWKEPMCSRAVFHSHNSPWFKSNIVIEVNICRGERKVFHFFKRLLCVFLKSKDINWDLTWILFKVFINISYVEFVYPLTYKQCLLK